jgi:hypothetical protein
MERERKELGMYRRPRFLLALVVACAGGAIAASSLGASTSDGVIANFAPGSVKLLHTGGSFPNSQYADLDRLKLPVGSWAITAHTVLLNRSGTPTGVDCYLVGPNGITAVQAHTPTELPAAKGTAIKDLTILSALTAPSGGNLDLMCKVSEKVAHMKVFAQDSAIMAVAVNGATVTHTPAPALGSY